MRAIALRGRAYPSDLNHSGTVFGGWIMAKMDKAASIAVEDIIDGHAVTVSVTDLHFLKPVRNGDIVTIYTEIIKIGHTSMQIDVHVQVKCKDSRQEYEVTNAVFTFVSVDEKGGSIPVRDVLRKDVDRYVQTLVS